MIQLIIGITLLCFTFCGDPDVYDKLHCKIMEDCEKLNKCNN